MAEKTYDGAEILQMKPQPEMKHPDPESMYSAGTNAWNALGLKPDDGKGAGGDVSEAHETDRKPFYL